MELINPQDSRLEKWSLLLAEGVFYLMSAGLVVLFSYLFFTKSTSSTAGTSPTPTLNKNILGKGPLSLESRVQTAELQPLLQELILVGASTRPDLDHYLVFALRSSGERKQISLRETLFLQEQEEGWKFSDDPTSIAVTPYSLERGSLLCKMKKEALQAECSFSSSLIFSKALEQEPYVLSLKNGQIWGSDVFLSGWGGDEFRDLSKKIKLSIGPDVFFLKSGDCLYWNGDRWVDECDSITPVALLTRSSDMIEFQVWDETGFSCEKIKLSLQTAPIPRCELSTLMTAIRPRSSKEITCLLGKRRVIIKEGDWWIRSGDRWKQVRTGIDLEACLHHHISGELFLFETVEASKGKIVVKGQVFDPMRTQSSPISLVVAPEKTSPSSVSPRQFSRGPSKRPSIANKTASKEPL